VKRSALAALVVLIISAITGAPDAINSVLSALTMFDEIEDGVWLRLVGGANSRLVAWGLFRVLQGAGVRGCKASVTAAGLWPITRR
jgi:hypothetical protein